MYQTYTGCYGADTFSFHKSGENIRGQIQTDPRPRYELPVCSVRGTCGSRIGAEKSGVCLSRRAGLLLQLLRDHPHIAEFFVSSLQEVFDLAAFEVAEGFGDVLFEV